MIINGTRDYRKVGDQSTLFCSTFIFDGKYINVNYAVILEVTLNNVM